MISGTNVGWEGWDNTGGRGSGGEGGVDNHVGEEITELGNAELDSSVELRGTGIGADFVVFHADGGERLEVAVHEEDMGPLEVDEGRGRIRESLLGSKARNVLNTLI